MYKYERKLIDYLPNVLKDIEDYKAVLNESSQIEIGLIFDSLENAINDQFVETATVNGVKRYEKILGINSKSSYSLDERKTAILIKMNEQLPYTLPVLKNQLNNICGEGFYDIELDYDNYYLKVSLGLKSKNSYDDVVSLLKRIVPANILLETVILYNQHKMLSRYTHKELAKNTHYNLRNNEGLNHVN